MNETEENNINTTIDWSIITSNDFLHLMYDINDWNQLLQWIDNNIDDNILTLTRVIECGWNAWGNDIKFINPKIVDFYIMLCKKRWLKQIYRKISNKMVIRDNIIDFGISHKKDTKWDKVIKINFIAENFVTHQFLYDCISEYVKNKKSVSNNQLSHTNRIYNIFLDKIEKRMEKN